MSENKKENKPVGSNPPKASNSPKASSSPKVSNSPKAPSTEINTNIINISENNKNDENASISEDHQVQKPAENKKVSLFSIKFEL